MKFPIIIFSKKNAQMGAIEKPYGSPHLLKDLVNSEVIDSNGILYFVEDVQKQSNINFLQTLKHFTPMVRYKFITNNEHVIDLDTLKNKVITNIRQRKNYWSALGTIADIQEMVEKTQTFEDIIKMFR